MAACDEEGIREVVVLRREHPLIWGGRNGQFRASCTISELYYSLYTEMQVENVYHAQINRTLMPAAFHHSNRSRRFSNELAGAPPVPAR